MFTFIQFSKNWTIVLFHYDGRIDEWDQFEWVQTAIHISARKQSKWYASSCICFIIFVCPNTDRIFCQFRFKILLDYSHQILVFPL